MLGNSATDSRSVISAMKRERRIFAPQTGDTEPEITGKWPRAARLAFILVAGALAWALIGAIVYLA